MKNCPVIIVVIIALSGLLAGCASQSPHPEPPVVADSPYAGPALPVVVLPEVSRKDPAKSRAVSEAVRNYLRDALDESLTASGVFSVVELTPGTSDHSDLPHLSAAIVSVGRHVGTIQLGPLIGLQKAVLDAKMEVCLTRSGRPAIVSTGRSSVARSEAVVVVAARKFSDWDFDESWASVACAEALQNACDNLAAEIKAEQRGLTGPAISFTHPAPDPAGSKSFPAGQTGRPDGNGLSMASDE